MISFVFGVFITIISKMAEASQCPSYCNADGFFVADHGCPPVHGVQQYCCGNETVRYCCAYASQDISNVYGDMCYCTQSSCSFTSWQTLGTVSVISVLFVIVLVGCLNRQCSNGGKNKCLFCCLRSSASRTTSEVQDQVQTVSGVLDSEMFVSSRDPPNRFIYSPPSYESIIKDPPKYEELPRENIVTVVGSSSALNINRTTADPCGESGTVLDPNTDSVPRNEITIVDVPPPYCTVEVDSSPRASHI